MASIKKRPDGIWRARYRDADGKEHARHFKLKGVPSDTTEATALGWLNSVTASVVNGTYLDPNTAKLTVGEWCQIWLKGYENNRVSTVRQARSHVKHIEAEFGTRLFVERATFGS
jgi:heme oxygenase